MNLTHTPQIEPGVARGQWWHHLDDGRVQCDLCPRYCKLKQGQRGFCFVRQARAGGMVLTSYGRASGFRVDPIEKKPLFHFYPGTTAYSFGTAGCNLGCRFCQNWEIPKVRAQDCFASWALPEKVVETAVKQKCRSVAFTYNDPVVFAEYAIDCARAAHERGLKTVAVSAGYITPEARKDFYAHIDAANIDLKAFTEQFYHKLCFAKLKPVLDTLQWLKDETDVWLEITTLLIPGHNDTEDEVARLCDWIKKHLGRDVPLHFAAFYPDSKMVDVSPTPPATLTRARQQALETGLHYVYTGNIIDPVGQATRCHGCAQTLIERPHPHRVSTRRVDAHGLCNDCGKRLAGHFGEYEDEDEWIRSIESEPSVALRAVL